MACLSLKASDKRCMKRHLYFKVIFYGRGSEKVERYYKTKGKFTRQNGSESKSILEYIRILITRRHNLEKLKVQIHRPVEITSKVPYFVRNINKYINMTTPVLTKKQQKHSLSAKTGPAKGLRNILAQPNRNFWPVINVDQYPELMASLNTILPRKQFDYKKDRKHVFKNLSKEDRVSAKKKMLAEAPPKSDILKFINIGINEITRALEKDNVCSILLDANIDKPMLIKHIITMAVNKKIPVLLVPILKSVTKEKIGFSTAALALKQEVKQCPDNVCHPLYKLIAEAFKDFESPKCSLQLFKSDEVPDKSAMCEAKSTVDSNTKPSISNPEKSVTVFTDVYKYRSSRDERVFIPPAVNKNLQVSKIPSDDFISLDSGLDKKIVSVNDENCISISRNRRYINLGQKEKRTIKSKSIEKQSFNELKLINNKADLTEQTKIKLSSQIFQTSSDDDSVDLYNDSVNDNNCASTSNNERYINIDKGKRTIKSENTEENQFFNDSKLINNKAHLTKHTKNILKRPKNDKPDYLSLKVKCIQGSIKRKKATKFAKKRKKG